ncbi:hypothetical protein GGF46_005455 [Coemansia sp. RSA 552]|nr:hypothetical protein GGF46_005455 [Coemansia sp. RSA 552]
MSAAVAIISADEALRRTTRILRRLYAREQQWLGSRTDQQTAKLTQDGQLQLSEQTHYGELAFVLLRLKPCAIVDFAADRDQLRQYIAAVITPTLRELNAVGTAISRDSAPATDPAAACFPRPFRLRCSRIDSPLASPEVPSWSGAYVVFDDAWPESATAAAEYLLNSARSLIEERDLARILDYPGSIPDEAEADAAIVPVSYLGRMKGESGEWLSDRWETLTSFIVQQRELPQTALHRIRYQAVRIFDIELQVAMDTSMIDDQQLPLPE